MNKKKSPKIDDLSLGELLLLEKKVKYMSQNPQEMPSIKAYSKILSSDGYDSDDCPIEEENMLTLAKQQMVGRLSKLNKIIRKKIGESLEDLLKNENIE